MQVMNKSRLSSSKLGLLFFSGLMLPSFLIGGVASCSTQKIPEASSSGQSSDYGTIEIVANGEDFIRQGLVSKDQWQIKFDHAYVNLANIAISPPLSSQSLPDQYLASVEVDTLSLSMVKREAFTVDLAEGDEKANPVMVTSMKAPVGHYQNLAWDLVPAEAGPAVGTSVLLEGVATKDSKTVQFSLKLNPSLSFVCGEYIGDERKGLLTKEQTAELEATFHFDHLFGDATLPKGEDINVEALGFEPIASLANNDGSIDADMALLSSKLPANESEKLQRLLLSLGHVGEGHCEAKSL